MASKKLESIDCGFSKAQLSKVDRALKVKERPARAGRALMGKAGAGIKIGMSRGFAKSSRTASSTKKNISALKKKATLLRKWRVGLNPYVDSLEIISLYSSKKKTIPANIEQWSKKFDFYQLDFGGDIFLKGGAKVKKLELAVEFDPLRSSKDRRAIAHSIFPKNQWKKYAQATVVFGLSTDLGFEVPLTAGGIPYASLGKIGPEVKGKFIAGPYKFSFEKDVIRGSGEGNFLVNWIVKDRKILREGDFNTKILIKVPKGRKSVKAKVEMLATVVPPGPFSRILGLSEELPLTRKTYDIEL